MPGFKFRCALVGHKSDVRAVSSFHSNDIVSASRDFTARLWHVSQDRKNYCPGAVLQGHENYLSSLAVYETEDLTNSLIYTGSNDRSIRVYSISQTKPKFVLKGHDDTVCSLCVDKFGTLISASWDKSVKVWKNERCVLTIRDHEAAVWCVVHVSGSETEFLIASGSADRSIRIYKVCLPSGQSEASYSTVRSLLGHTDCVRGLSVLDPHHILSASNDASIRAWDLRTGQCVGEFYGHTNYVYDIATRPGVPIFVSSGEDRSVRVWAVPKEQEWAEGKQFNAIQCLPLPCQSAWCVTLLSNGDIIVGGSDSVLRAFSSDPTRQSSEDALKTYEAELASSEIQAPNASDTGDLDLKKLPGVEALLNPGKREGQVIVIKQDDRTVCYQWSTTESRWLEIGDVVGSQSTNRMMYEGKEYDFVFTVDIAEHLPPLKLPYNRTEDPWFVAHTFLQRNDLPGDYLDTVANFIIRNAGPQVGSSVSNQSEYVDPYTGSSRYIPEGMAQTNQTAAPSLVQEKLEPPFPSDTFIPLKGVSLGPLLGKLELFFNELGNSPEKLLEQARQFSFDMSDMNALHLTETLLQTLTLWPVDKLIPVLDLLRCLVFWRNCCQMIFSQDHWSCICKVSVDHADMPHANILLLVRLMANVLAADGPAFLASPDTFDSNALVSVVNLAANACSLAQNSQLDITARKQLQLAIATLIHNLTVLAYLSGDCPKAYTHLPRLIGLPGVCIRIGLFVLNLSTSHGSGGVTLLNPDAVYNLLVSIGTSLFTLTKSENDDTTVEVLKTRRIRFIASAAVGILLQDKDTKSMDDAEIELLAWEQSRSVINYWSSMPTAVPKVRSCASCLLQLLD